jgi:2-polyprenyl-3-methyl-5-hydroxy-6-metoxy-1,4-benzoquinol methylase
MSITSPLTGRSNVLLKRKISCKELIKHWQNDFGIDISKEFENEEYISEYQCLDTSLYFFRPNTIAGSAYVYEQLQKFDWYYNPDKWEHQQIIRKVQPGMRVLEIGCGEGSFVAKCGSKGADAIGLELNEAAVEVGKRNGLNLKNELLEDFSEENSNKFDIVCCFQVLEHIPNPMAFITKCLEVTKVGGLLIFGVPNANSFFGRNFSILDLPPHHMLRWSKPAFISLESIFKMKLNQIQFEPLASYHISWFIGLLKKKKNIWSRLIRSEIFRKTVSLLLKSGGRKLIHGHTVLATFKNLDS